MSRAGPQELCVPIRFHRLQLLGAKARGWKVPSADSHPRGDFKPDGALLMWDFLVYGDLLDLTMVRGL